MRISGKLKEKEIQDLLNYYKSEARKLKVISDNVRMKIRELEGHRAQLKEQVKAKADVPKAKPGRPARVREEKKPRKAYPLSQWDVLIIESIRNAGKVLVNKEILEDIKEKAITKGFFRDEKHARIKLNQCLVKLSNRRDDLVKVKHKGRGFAYALAEWMSEKKRLRKEYKM